MTSRLKRMDGKDRGREEKGRGRARNRADEERDREARGMEEERKESRIGEDRISTGESWQGFSGRLKDKQGRALDLKTFFCLAQIV